MADSAQNSAELAELADFCRMLIQPNPNCTSLLRILSFGQLSDVKVSIPRAFATFNICFLYRERSSLGDLGVRSPTVSSDDGSEVLLGL